ncbi:helix-turn-helix domain-containing protein [Kribbella sp. CWNU-51]
MTAHGKWAAVGIGPQDELLYESLLPRRQETVADLAEQTGVSREAVTKALGRLVDRGLVSRLPGRPARYSAVMPDLAVAGLIAARERELNELRKHAQQLAAAHRGASTSGHPAELIEVIEGASNVRRAFFRLHHTAHREMRVFDKPPYTASQPDGNHEEYELLGDAKITYRTLYDQEALTIPDRMSEIWNGIRHGERARVAGTLPMKMALCDDRLGLIPVSTSEYLAEAAYLVHPSSLLDALSALFEATWQRAISLNQPDKAEREGELAPADHDLIGLLAAGATDDTIARTFGWSIRTVHRHVHRIMSLVGAGTRFQVGMEAVRRQWV